MAKAKKEKLAKRHKHLNRSGAGNFLTFLFLLLLGLFMLFPFVYVINNAFKPLNELFIYPPKLFVQQPTTDNFSQLFVLMGESTVTFSRYLFNTVFITAVGTVGHILFASLAAFVLSKYRFPGSRLLFSLVVTSLMFISQVTAIANYITLSELHWIDTSLSVIVPAFGTSMGLFLMKQFMDSMVPGAMIESAAIDGAGILKTFWHIVMPMVKPAWVTLIIFDIQSLWNATGGTYLISEEKKTLPYALSQITASGIARTGVASAASVIIMIVPIVTFIISQSNVVETMAASGIKE
jgi:ABC transporter, permease protein